MPARPKKKAPVAAKAKSKRPTVASLSAEVTALRTQVEALQERLSALESSGGGAKTATAAAATAASVTAAAATAAVASKAARPAAKGKVGNLELALKSLLTGAFGLALEPMPEDPDDSDRLFERFAALCHSSRCGTPMLDTSLRTYTWRQLRKNAGIYLREDGDASSFEVLRTEPRKLNTDSHRVKFFLRAKTRMPTPITFRRDADEEGEWRIEVSSL